MNRILTLAAGSAVAALCLAAAPVQPIAPSHGVSAAAPAAAPMASDDRDGKYKSDEEHAKDIRWLLADIADRAAADDGWQRVSDWLSSNDRHRIEDGLKKAKTGDYAEYAQAFRKVWKDKYGSAFNAHKMADDIIGMKLEFETRDDRKFATATFAPFGGMQGFEMRLQLEARDKWRIEIPNTVDAQKYIDGLQQGLKSIVDHKASLNGETEGLNASIAQMLHGLGFDENAAKTSSRKHT